MRTTNYWRYSQRIRGYVNSNLSARYRYKIVLSNGILYYKDWYDFQRGIPSKVYKGATKKFTNW